MEDLSGKKQPEKPSPEFTTRLELLQKTVGSLSPMDVGKEVKDFSAGGAVHEKIVETGDTLEKAVDRDTLKTTVAMFNYIAKCADVVGKTVDTAIEALPEKEKTPYLEAVNSLMSKKIADFPIWAGEDRQRVGFGALSASTWFKQGKADLLTKSGTALKDDKLKSFLFSYVDGMKDKGYGRRVYSLEEGAKLESLAPSDVVVEEPAVGVAISHTQKGYEYFEYDEEMIGDKISPSELKVAKVYALYIFQQKYWLVTIGSNTASDVTFSKVSPGSA